MNIAFNRFTGFVARFFRSFTKTITHPYVAWSLFLLYLTVSSFINWGAPPFLDETNKTVSLRLEFDRELLRSQDEILERLEKAMTESGDSK